MPTSNSFITINDILADVLPMVGDLDFKKGLSRGFYVRQIANAIEELAKDTYFQILTTDYPFPESYILPLPENCFNVREIYLYTGECGLPEVTKKVYFKHNFNNTGGGTGYTAKRKENQQQDPFMDEDISGRMKFYEPNLYYANIQNGDIMFGSSCSQSDYVRLVYNGMGGNIGDTPAIHREFRMAVRDWVRCSVLKVFMVHDKNAAQLFAIADRDLNGDGRPMNPGSWLKAQRQIKRMGTWAKRDYDEYMSKMNY